MTNDQKQEFPENINLSTNSNGMVYTTNTLGVPVAQNSLYDHYVFPTLLTRIKALIIDLIILLLVFLCCSYVFDSIKNIPGFFRAFILIFMIYIYDPLMVSQFGGTLGHISLGMRVKNYNNPLKNISLFRALFRFFIKWLLGWASFISVTISKNKRAIHDYASGSIVIFRSKPHLDS